VSGEPVAAMVLAAGAGERYGEPKALARTGGESWLVTSLLRLAAADYDPVVIVLGAGAVEALDLLAAEGIRASAVAGAESTEPALGPPDPGLARSAPAGRPKVGPAAAPARNDRFLWVCNHDWRLGRTGSIHRGLESIPPACCGVLIHQVDFPEVRTETFAFLRACFMEESGRAERIVLPTREGKRGHPILVGRGIWPEIRALAADEPLFRVVRRDPERVREVAVSDPGIHHNRNLPSGADGSDSSGLTARETGET